MRKKVLWIAGGIALAACCVPAGLLMMVWGVFVAEDIASDLKLRRYQPTSLMDAVSYKYATPEMVAGFIDRGADVNEKFPGTAGAKPYALVCEASSRGNVEVTRLLLRRGARVDEACLWTRAREGQEAMARMLVDEGASLGRQPDYQEGIGPELMQAAAFGGQAWLVQRIAQKGGDVQMVNAGGAGLLALALQSEYRATRAHARPARALDASAVDCRSCRRRASPSWAPAPWGRPSSAGS